jgi:hypothetical protein
MRALIWEIAKTIFEVLCLLFFLAAIAIFAASR